MFQSVAQILGDVNEGCIPHYFVMGGYDVYSISHILGKTFKNIVEIHMVDCEYIKKALISRN